MSRAWACAFSGLGEFIGFGNYAEMMSREDFWEAMWHTLQFTLYTRVWFWDHSHTIECR